MNDATWNLPILACSRHEDAIRRARQTLGESDGDIWSQIEKLDEDTWFKIEESSECPYCQLIVGLVLKLIDRRKSRMIEQEDDLLVHGIKKYSGEELERRIRGNGPIALVPKNGDLAVMEPVGMFLPSYEVKDRPSGKPTCTVVLWKFRKGETCYKKSLQIDEMSFFLLHGELEWMFDGGGPVKLGFKRSSDQLMWISANPHGKIGIPPFRIQVESDYAYGVAVLYKTSGLELGKPDRHGRIEVPGSDWGHEETTEYWKVISEHIHQMKGRRPFNTRVPVGKIAIEEIDKLRKRRIEGYAHSEAKKRKQLIDRYLPLWPLEDSMDFNSPEMLLRPHPMLDFCLIEFPAQGSKTPKDRINVAKHRECFEVMIPLYGEVRSVALQMKSREGELKNADLGHFAQQGRKPCEKKLRSSSMIGRGVPDILLLDSSFFHGFTSLGNERAFALHIRCYDYDPRGERRRGVSEDIMQEPIKSRSIISRKSK